MRSALRAAAIFLIAIGVVLALPTTSNADNGLTVAETHVQAHQWQAAKVCERVQLDGTAGNLEL